VSDEEKERLPHVLLLHLPEVRQRQLQLAGHYLAFIDPAVVHRPQFDIDEWPGDVTRASRPRRLLRGGGGSSVVAPPPASNSDAAVGSLVSLVVPPATGQLSFTIRSLDGTRTLKLFVGTVLRDIPPCGRPH
jgi:hypothetical protein